MVLPILSALGGGLLSSISGSSQRRELNSRIDSLISQLKRNMLDEKDIQGYNRNINATYNNSLSTLLNKTAFSSRSAINSGVVKAAAAAPVEASRLSALTEMRTKADSFNLNIQNQISQLEMSKATGDNVGDFVGGAVQGGIAGAQISKLMESPTKLDIEESPESLKEGGISEGGSGNYSLSDLSKNTPMTSIPSINNTIGPYERMFSLTGGSSESTYELPEITVTSKNKGNRKSTIRKSTDYNNPLPFMNFYHLNSPFSSGGF